MGCFITFEGIDGCGKSTQASLLASYFREMGRTVLHTFEPGATPLGAEIRQTFLRGSRGELDPVTETLLMAADRAHHVRSVVRPALEDGAVVICERYADSMEAYQGYGDKVALDLVRSLNRIATDGLEPDITFLLDIPPEEALRRKRKDPDRIEARGLAFHEAVRSGYLAISREHARRIAVLDARKEADKIHEEVVRHLSERGLAGAALKAGGTGQ